MKRIYLSLSAAAIAALLLVPASIHAQEKENKQKEKEKTEKKEGQQIIITTKTDSKEKIVVEINGDKVTVNGKPIEDLKKDGDISVNVHKLKGMNGLMAYGHADNAFTYNWNDNKAFTFNGNENTAMLGVVTDKTDNGVKVTEVNDETAAAKMGLKEDDIITKVDGKKVADPDDLTKIIRGHKPGDKVAITYERDKKEQTATAELGKFSGPFIGNFSKTMPSMDFKVMPKLDQSVPRSLQGQNGYNTIISDWNRPKLGLSVQDTDDGKGVKVLDVDNESNAAKAGVKKDDVIISINDKEVNSADEVAKIVRELREKVSMKLKVNRGGKTQDIEVKLPRKLQTKDI